MTNPCFPEFPNTCKQTLQPANHGHSSVESPPAVLWPLLWSLDVPYHSWNAISPYNPPRELNYSRSSHQVHWGLSQGCDKYPIKLSVRHKHQSYTHYINTTKIYFFPYLLTFVKGIESSMQGLTLSHSKSFQQYEVVICIRWDIERATRTLQQFRK